MDNLGANGSVLGEDTFGYVPPDFMYGVNRHDYSGFSSKEEEERYYYHLEEDDRKANRFTL